MTDQEINVTIAEVCGFKPSDYPGQQIYCKTDSRWWEKDGRLYAQNQLPNYCADLNAMQAAVTSQTPDFQWRFDAVLKQCVAGGYFHNMTALTWANCFMAESAKGATK